MEYYTPYRKFGQPYSTSEGEVNNYFKEIVEWITKKYSAKPIEKDCRPVLIGWCRKI